MFVTRSIKSGLRSIKGKLSSLGPGFITGAADDDPSGVAMYSISGAQFGYALNWLILVCLPLMIAVQEVCARIGIVTGRGLAGVIRKYYSRKFLYVVVALLAFANIVNIGADLGAMADVIVMVVGFPWWLWLVLVTIFAIILEVWIPYRTYEPLLKLFAFFLLSYLATAIIVSPNVGQVVKSIFLPHVEFSLPFLAAAVGFLGTTISPYLFFWQASEEVEDEIVKRRIHGFGMGKPKFNQGDIKRMRLDTNAGMIFSQIVTLAIIITTTETIHHAGLTTIVSAKDAALALRPLAGDLAYLLFAIGIVGVGLQSIPILAGSLAYAVAEVFHRPEGLGKPFSRAKFFYFVIIAASILGSLINVLGINPIKALYYAAIVNGIVAVPLIATVTLIGRNQKIMGRETSGPLSSLAGVITTLVMGIAALAMIVLALKGL